MRATNKRQEPRRGFRPQCPDDHQTAWTPAPPAGTSSANPWLAQLPEPDSRADEPRLTSTVVAIGPTRPQLGVPAPDAVDQLPVRQASHLSALWVLGAHGGAAESTVAQLDARWASAGHVWPAGTPSEPTQVLVTARTSARGLDAAQSAAKQWAAGLIDGVQLLGLVLVADVPGRLPRPLRDRARLVGGGYPRTWQLPWIDSWRLGDDIRPDTAPREVRRLMDDLYTLTATRRTTNGRK